MWNTNTINNNNKNLNIMRNNVSTNKFFLASHAAERVLLKVSNIVISFLSQTSSCLMEVPGVIMTLCCHHDKYVLLGRLSEHKGNKLNNSGGEFVLLTKHRQWLTVEGYSTTPFPRRLHTGTRLLLLSCLCNLLFSSVHQAWAHYLVLHFSLPGLGVQTTTCLHPICPDQWAGRGQLRWHPRIMSSCQI